jgi:tubulin-like protein CetZ
MKIVALGLGQCGGNIADEMYSMNNYAESIFNRRLEILTDAFALNTDEADLGGFAHIPKDRQHRILIGSKSTFGHGVGKMNNVAADIIKSSNSVVTDTLMHSDKFHESDAVMVIASGGGGTGSGTIGWAIKSLKERVDKPVYAIIVLPFAFEEQGEASFAVMNTATCVNTVLKYADAVFLIDNERYRKSGSNLANTFKEVNKDIANSFYDLCCAGEERNLNYIGGKVVDAGDIKQSLEGLTNIGRGEVSLGAFKPFNVWNSDFRDGMRSQNSTFQALGLAEGNSALNVQLGNARKILLLVSAPKDAITATNMEEISNYLQNKAPQAIIRMGDYPRRSREISVTLIASQLTGLERLERLFAQANEAFQRRETIVKETASAIERLYAQGAALPRLD